MKKLIWLFSLIIAFNLYGQTTENSIESGESSLAIHDTLGALAVFNAGIDSGNPESYYSRGYFKYFELDDNEGALADLSKAIEIDSEYSDAYLLRGRAKDYLQQDHEGALADFNKALELDSVNSKAYYYRGYFKYFVLDDKAAALADLSRAVEIDSEYSDAYLLRGRAKDHLQDHSALPDFSKVIELDSVNLEAYYYRGRFKYFVLDDNEGALADFNKAIELNSEFSDPYYYRAELKRYVFDDNDGAFADYNKAIEIDSVDSEFYYSRGDFKHYRLNDNEGALADYNKAIELDSEFSDAYYSEIYLSRGDLKHYRLDDNEGALDDFNKALELDSVNSMAYYHRGQFKYYVLDDNAAALADYNKAIEIDSVNSEYYYLRSILYRHNGEYESSIADLRRAIMIDPLSSTYHNSLAKDLDQVKKYEEAKNHYETSQRLENDRSAASDHNTHGNYYPDVVLYNNDSLKFPIIVDIELFVEDIYNLNISSDQFFLGFKYGLYSKYPPEYISEIGDTLSRLTDLENVVTVQYVKSEETRIDKLNYKWYNKSLGHYYNGSVESSFYHNWQLRDYPLDEQHIQVRFLSSLDSTIFKFRESQKFPAEFVKNMIGLSDGYQIEEINFHQEFQESWMEIELSPSLTRKTINPVGVFNIVVSRTGSGLMIKLFLGALLSYIISWLVFTIPKRDFGSRIELSVGAIFGAIGNKYFVESTTPALQVLTKADLINNLVILMVLFNIILIILQRNKKINVGKFENSKFALTFSAATMIILTLITIII